MRILIGLTEVSGYYARLKEGFEELGINSFFVSLQEHRFKYDESKHLPLIYRFSRYCVTERVQYIQQSSRIKVWFLTPMVIISRILLFLWALFNFDVFLMGGGSSFFRFCEFPILKLFNKKIIYTFHGTDSRPSYIDGFASYLDGFDHDKIEIEKGLLSDSIVDNYIKVARRNKRTVEKIEKYSDVIINAPSQAQFHSRPYIIGLVAGLPLKLKANVDYNEKDSESSSVRILHSPSHIEGKGTIKIREAISSLINKGHNVEYFEISGKPNAEVLEAIKRCDFVVDQLYSDSPMAGFASEAALDAKPAIVGGYYSNHIKDDLRPEWIPPSLYCHPDEIEKAIEQLIVDKEYRQQLGKKAQEFVIKNWNAKMVASRYLCLINDEFPREWLYNPKHNKYLNGMGMPEEKARNIIRSIVNKRGRSALMLNNNPELEQRFIDFAFQKSP